MVCIVSKVVELFVTASSSIGESNVPVRDPSSNSSVAPSLQSMHISTALLLLNLVLLTIPAGNISTVHCVFKSTLLGDNW